MILGDGDGGNNLTSEIGPGECGHRRFLGARDLGIEPLILAPCRVAFESVRLDDRADGILARASVSVAEPESRMGERTLVAKVPMPLLVTLKFVA